MRGPQIFVSEHHPGARETVMLLHAGVTAGWMWHDHLATLTDYHILVPDLPGFGRSNDVDFRSARDAAAACAETIEERGHDGRAHVVGLSLGGMVALWLLSEQQSLIRSAFLSGIPTRPSGATARIGHALLLALWHQRWFWELGYRFGPFPKGHRQRFVETALGISSASQRKVFSEDRRAELPSGLSNVQTDTLVLAATRDAPAIRDGATDLRAMMPAARLAYIADAGHLWPVTHPGLFEAALPAWLHSREIHRGLVAEAGY